MKKGAIIGRLLAQPHGTFTPPAVCRSPTHCLRRFERSDCGYKGVSLCILRVVANKPLHLFSGAVLIAQLSGQKNPARIVSWRTRRVARRKRNVSDLPYNAPPLSCGHICQGASKAFFGKQRKGGRRLLFIKPRKRGQPA